MTRSHRFISVVGFAAIAFTSIQVASHAQQRDARTTAGATPTGTGSISGIVTSADGAMRPLKAANVVLIGAITGTLRVTSTDAEGRFSFANLPADRYIAGASKPPYLGAVAGAKRPARPGTPIALLNGQKLDSVSIQLPMGAAISGNITDERGRPASNASMTVQQWRTQNGERALATVPGAMVSIDERGRYRVYGLAPGEYIVSALAPSASVHALTEADVDAAMKQPDSAAVIPIGADPGRFAPVFFPGVSRSTEATPITVSAGEEHTGADFRLEPFRMSRIEGIVSTGDGPPAGRVLVLAYPSTAAGFRQVYNSLVPTPDGRFTFQSLPPGGYDLVVQTNGPASVAGPQFGLTRIEVNGADQSGIAITLRPAMTLSAHLQFDGASVPVLAGRRVPIQTLTPGQSSLAPVAQPTDAIGGFTIARVIPGRYVIGGPLFFGATGDSVTWALDSVIVDGANMTDLPVDITADRPPKSIAVTYTDRWQELTGKLQLSSGAAAAGYTLVVFPADKTYWVPGSRRILTTRPGTDGVFRFGGAGPNTLPPGDYLLAAVTDIDRDEQFDPAFLDSLIQAGTAITIKPGERKTQDLAIR